MISPEALFSMLHILIIIFSFIWLQHGLYYSNGPRISAFKWYYKVLFVLVFFAVSVFSVEGVRNSFPVWFE